MYCVTQKPEQYVEELSTGSKLGLYSSYGYNPDLFNLLSRTSLAFFMYEPGFRQTEPGSKLNTLHNIEAYKACLTPEIRKLLNSTNPEEFFNLKPELKQIRDPDLDLIMQLRVLQWKKHYRGRLKGIEVQFRSRLTAEEEKFLADAIRSM